MEQSSMIEPTIDHARQAAGVFRTRLPRFVHAKSFTLKSKNPFKAMVLREALIHRLSSLADGVVSEFDAGRWVSASILVRAIVESTAVLYSLELQVSNALKALKDDALTQFLRDTMVSSRSDPKLPKAINVLTLIDKVDKQFNGFRSGYDDLCEYAHPNWCGVLGSFSELNRETITVSFSTFAHPSATTANISAFMGALTVAQYVYNKCEESISLLSEAFDRGIFCMPHRQRINLTSSNGVDSRPRSSFRPPTCKRRAPIRRGLSAARNAEVTSAAAPHWGAALPRRGLRVLSPHRRSSAGSATRPE
jgi:hypothetical protein